MVHSSNKLFDQKKNQQSPEADVENELTPDGSSMSSNSSTSSSASTSLASSPLASPISSTPHVNQFIDQIQNNLNNLYRQREESSLTPKAQFERLHNEYVKYDNL